MPNIRGSERYNRSLDRYETSPKRVIHAPRTVRTMLKLVIAKVGILISLSQVTPESALFLRWMRPPDKEPAVVSFPVSKSWGEFGGLGAETADATL